MTSNFLNNKPVAATPIVLVVVLMIFYNAFQFIYIQCSVKGYNPAGCKPIEIEPLFPRFPVNACALESPPSAKPEGTPEETSSRGLLAKRYSGRNTWVFLSFVNTLLCIVALIVASLLIHKSSSYRGERKIVRVGILVGLSMLLGYLFWLLPFYMPTLKKVLEKTVEADEYGMPTLLQGTRLILNFTFAATFALIFATSAVLLPRRKVADGAKSGSKDLSAMEKVRNQLAPYSEQMTDLRIMLSAGTALLVIGVLRLNAEYQWSLTFLKENAAKAAEPLTSSLVTDAGGFFTLTLAAVYLPAAYIIHRRAQLVVQESDLEPEEREAVLKDQKFTFSVKDALPRILIILGPLLAGPVGDLIRGMSTP